MQLINCYICNKPFLKKRRDICPKCIEIEVDMLNTIRRYLRDNPKAKLDEVSENTGIDKRFINKSIREGRLDLTIRCGKCGIKIKNTHGRKYCSTCAELVKKGIMSSAERLAMERDVRDKKIIELKQKNINNTLRKSLYGLGSGDEV